MYILSKYELLNKIGSGSFGYIYKARNIRTNSMVAIKTENIKNGSKLLKNETIVYQYLSGLKGVPNVLWFGKDEYNYYMVLDLLGISLTSLRESNSLFSLQTTIAISKKLLEILKEVHNKGIIHRDIKPDNFMFDFSNEPVLYLIDFGFCKKYIEDSGAHICEKSGKEIMGTINYISINIHNGIEASRRDDLESLAYILLQVLDGDLPWNTQHLNAKKEMKLSKFNYPVINTYLNYCRNLKFSETPDYVYLLQLF